MTDADLFHFDSVDSTNDAAKRLIASGCIGRSAAVTARMQTAGRGTNGRTWVSPDGGIYLSVVLPDAEPPLEATTAYTLAAGVGCVEALRDHAGVSIHLKPVNDLMIDGQKLGGILTEALFERGRLQAIIIGVGINFARVSLDLPAEGPRAISLEEVLNSDRFVELSRDDLTRAVALAVHRRANQVSRGDTSTIAALWEQCQCPKHPGTSPAFDASCHQPAAQAGTMIE